LYFFAKHGKSYASRRHMENRYEVFKANYIDVQTTNARSFGIKLAINEFSDLTEEEFGQAFVSGARPKSKLRLKSASKIAANSNFDRIQVPEVWADSQAPWEIQNGKTLPESIDWHKAGKVTEPDT